MQKENVTHYYYEIGGELLAKPQALGDILEYAGFPICLIYCNSPSDTDLVEVLLKKKGICASKLIGHVSPAKVEQTMARIAAKEITALVVTDIAARVLNLQGFPLIVNYSIHEDPEVYLERCGLKPMTREGDSDASTTGQDTTAQQVISLVSPLDIANFHYLKKLLGLEFAQKALPAREELMRAKVDNLSARAKDKTTALDAQFLAMAKLVLANQNNEQIISYLMHNSFEVLPQMMTDIEKLSAEKEMYQDDSYQPGSRRDDGQNNMSAGRNGNQRGGGGRGRGPRQYKRGGSYRDRSEGYGGDSDERPYRPSSNASESQDNDNQRQYYGNEGRGGDEGQERDGRYNRQRRTSMPRIREDRLYIGAGSKKGLSESKFLELLQSQCGLTAESLKRFSLRENYAFADVPEQATPEILAKLKGTSIDGAPLFITKAITITSTPQEMEHDEDSPGTTDDASRTTEEGNALLEDVG